MQSRDDSEHLKNVQYKTADNLNARIQIHVLYNTNTYSVMNWQFDILLACAAVPAPRVLEIGCGTGALWTGNISRVPESWDITLTDFSEGMLAETQSNLSDHSERFKYQQADAQDLPFEDNQFDIVIANYMLYHVPDRPKALREMRRVMQPGGHLHAMTNGAGHMGELKTLAANITGWSIQNSPTTSAHFRLENGGIQLAHVFNHVQRIDFPCDLAVTDVQHVLDYIASVEEGKNRLQDETTRQKIIDAVQTQIDETGHFYIHKSTGLFIAR
ncbi:MAG: class I SAM-dependent methyltransferase [Aggregatilineales bacterium]